MTDARGQSYVPDHLFKAVYVIPSGYWQGTFLQKWQSLGYLLSAFWKASLILRRLRPHAIWGFGGAASLTPLLLSTLYGIPRGIYQLDAVLGRANRWLLPFVHKIASGFQEIQGLPSTPKVLWTSFPVRKNVHSLPYLLPSSAGPFKLLILGGSQGAQIFSSLLPQAVAFLDVSLQKKIWILQQCRADLLKETQRAYHDTKAHVTLTPFIEEMGAALGDAHLVITRAGASTIGELACVGRPALFVPYPHAADNHQAENARLVVEAEAGWLFPQHELTPQKLALFLEETLAGPEILIKYSTNIRSFYQEDGLSQIVDVIAGWISAKAQ